MHLRLSRRRLRCLVWIGLPVLALVGLVLLGRSVTPYDTDGEPLILSPSLKATLAYQTQVRRWVGRLSGLDRDLEALLSERQDIYRQTQVVDDLLNRSLRLAQDVEIRRAPAALAGLRGLLAQTSLAYLETARAAADWLGAPTLERERDVYERLEAARELLAQVTGSRWLEESEPDSRPPNEIQERDEWQ